MEIDTRILALALARMVDALANSFLVVVLPLYIGQVVALPGFVGTTVHTDCCESLPLHPPVSGPEAAEHPVVWHHH
jgi:hypothetical protein